MAYLVYSDADGKGFISMTETDNPEHVLHGQYTDIRDAKDVVRLIEKKNKEKGAN